MKGRTAVITGGSRGIGKAVAIRYAREGINIAICSRHVNPELERELSGLGILAKSYVCDVSQVGQVEDTVQKVQKIFGSIDILVNVAGISPKDGQGMKIPCFSHTVEMWHEVMDINLNGTFYFSRAVLDGMMRKKWGRIINMSSIVGMTSSEHGPACAAYVTSKTGVVGLTRAMAYDLAPYGITVNAVAPGRIDTEMSAMNNNYYNELHKKIIPMHRFGTVDEVAEACLFLASEQAAYITGETLNITGGWFL